MATQTTTPKAFTPNTGFKSLADDPYIMNSFDNSPGVTVRAVKQQPAQKPAQSPQQSPSTEGRMTVDQFGKTIKAQYPQYANIPDDQLGSKMLEKYPVYKNKIVGMEYKEPEAPKPKEGEGDGFFQGLARPFVKLGVTGVAAVDSAIKAISGDLPAADRVTQEGYNVPGFGQVAPAKIGQDIEIKKDDQGNEQASGGYFGTNTLKTIGTGAEIAPWLMGAGEVNAGLKGASAFAGKGLGSKVLTGALEGGIGGAVGGLGAGLQNDENGIMGQLESGATGAAGGGAAGAVIGGAAPIVVNALKGVGGFVGRSLKGVRTAIENSDRVAADVAAIKTSASEQATTLRQMAEGQSEAFRKAAEAEARAIEKAGTERAASMELAKKSGLDNQIVDFVQTSTPEDKSVYKKMFDLAETGSKDLRERTQPKALAGQTVLDTADHLIKVKNKGVEATNRVLNSLDQKPQDATNLFMNFLRDMEDKGVVAVKRGKGIQLVPTRVSKVVEEDIPFYQAIFNKLAPDDNGRVFRSYRDLHQLRQYIFEKFNLAKARQQPFSDDLAHYAERLRSEILQPIDTASRGKYKIAQQATAESMGALRDFVQLLGYKGNLENLVTKDLRTGEVASRVLGNAADRPTSILQKLAEVAQKYGHKPKGNFMDQLQFADLLENFFGTKQTRSLRGEVGRAGMDVFNEVAGAAGDAAHGNILALGSRVAKAVLGKSKEDQINALKALLEQESKSYVPRTNFGRR